MKKYIITLASAVLFLTACEEDFLTLAPISQPNADNFYLTQNDFINAVNAAYANMQNNAMYGNDFISLIELRSDNVFDNDPSANAGLRFNIDRFQEPNGNTILLSTWGVLYRGINRCNNVLTRIDEVTMDEAVKKSLKGEAQFIRALHYFHLVQLWGKVPLVLTPDNSTESRSHKRDEVSAVWAAVEKDLQDAITNLPATQTGANLGRATSGAAKSLLGKVYLTQKKFSQAKTILKEVIDAGVYKLMPTNAEVFSTKQNAEIIFAIRYKKGGVGEGHGLWYGSAIGDLIETSLRAAYEPTDARLDLLTTVKPAGSATIVPKKFFEELSTANDVGNDWPVIRYADVLLMYAEALNEEGFVADGEALATLNLVRARAKATPFTSAQLTDQAAFRKAVLNERRLELALENHRWYDLTRTGTAIEAIAAVGLTINPNRFLYPIPQSQIEIMNDPTNFAQNPGY